MANTKIETTTETLNIEIFYFQVVVLIFLWTTMFVHHVYPGSVVEGLLIVTTAMVMFFTKLCVYMSTLDRYSFHNYVLPVITNVVSYCMIFMLKDVMGIVFLIAIAATLDISSIILFIYRHISDK